MSYQNFKSEGPTLSKITTKDNEIGIEKEKHYENISNLLNLIKSILKNYMKV